ncbi:hypothetical protein ACJRO7_003510 [Eucalyptus globulus]|uniref:Uncharacterized protein n=1 Tax=Eucalyptus globulus TaxID=34317 RepID=A0ABD3IX31_EUCGL
MHIEILKTRWSMSAIPIRRSILRKFYFFKSFYYFLRIKLSLMRCHKPLIFEKRRTASNRRNQMDTGERTASNRPACVTPVNFGTLAVPPIKVHVLYSIHHRGVKPSAPAPMISTRDRWDYTNPYLPVAPSAIDGSGQLSVGLDGKKLEPESNVLLVSIENMQYAVRLDVLHMVFSAFGPVQKIAMFGKNGTAVVAKEALEGHCIYDGGFCKLHISYSRHTDLSIKVNNDRSRDYTIPNTPMMNPQPSILGQQPASAVGAAPQQHGGVQYAPTPAQPTMHHPPLAGWGPVPPAQSMPMQGHNPPPYMQPGTLPFQMGPGMMHGAGHPGLSHPPPMPPYQSQ